MKRNNRQYVSLLFILLSGFLGVSCDTDFPLKQLNTSEDYELIYDYVSARPDLSVYKDLCDYTGFVGTVSTAGTYTAFVPTDSAFQVLFDRLGIESYTEKEADYWLNYLQYHTLTVTKNTSAFVSGLMTEATLMGKNFKLTVDISQYPYLIFNNSARITEPNIIKQNGNINILDAVLMPPISSVYDLLKENGGYSKMLALFDKYQLGSYLTDSLATVMVEPDIVFEENGIDPDTISNLEDWLKYHIIPGERSFMSDLDGRYVKTLYEKDGITFNYLTRNDMVNMYCNQQFPFCNRADYTADQIALNGVLHPLELPLAIVQHTAGRIRMNLYGGTSEVRGYQKNVFAEVPALVRENYTTSSFHQGMMAPCCEFYPSQIGDECYLTVPDIVPGTYTVRLLYYASGAPNMTLLYNGAIVTSNIKFSEKGGDFSEWTSLQYKDCGTIDVLETGDVSLRFKVSGTTMGVVKMDMLELIPIIK